MVDSSASGNGHDEGASERKGEAVPEPDVREQLFVGGHRDQAHLFRSLGLVAQLGLVVALCVCGGLVGGFTLDRLLGWSGPLTATGVVLGVAAGFYAAGKLLFRDVRGAAHHERERIDDRQSGP